MRTVVPKQAQKKIEIEMALHIGEKLNGRRPDVTLVPHMTTEP
jgi:hypothetical protein